MYGYSFVQIVLFATKEANLYIYGSLPFMEAMIKILHKWEVPKELIHYESFSPIAILGE
ncbi:hypothetical protein PDR89_03710 [Bacillus cereus group sp. Bc002]|uniref:hypothetical protein n=1 Tax=unclassified Bacillus cereus group TaxID=2750818 RepID=UPI0022E78F91|nr:MULTISPECIES: hypothetical protein [unclassified Bacillus cereus group]MDA2139537.1 hypothetical protein [Bacillus cereus group sp. Bc256]MDA2778565.1 hypothetical protein [Bacillus cereus group sp. Bc002]